MKDRINLKIGEVTFVIAPLSFLRKQELAGCTKMQGGEEIFDLGLAQAYYIKYALKDIKGVKDYHGNDYKLEFEGDALTDDCVSEIFMLEQKESMLVAAWQCLNGIQELKDPITGKKLKGVEIEVTTEGK